MWKQETIIFDNAQPDEHRGRTIDKVWEREILGSNCRQIRKRRLRCNRNQKIENRKYTSLTWKPYTRKITDNKESLFLRDIQRRTISQHSCTECISHKGLLASTVTQLWRRSHTISLARSRALALSLYTHNSYTTYPRYVLYYTLSVCPRCIYTHTQYGVFTNIAIIINNNNNNNTFLISRRID